MSSKSKMLKPEAQRHGGTEEKPLVSIITPSYNQGAFIGETIQSILGQDYPHLEYIIMDGGSSDNTLDVIRGFDDPRLTWVSEADRGMTHALNKGFGRSAGQIMGWLNSDDVFLTKTVVSEAVAYFQEHPEADLLYRDAIYTDAAGKPIGRKQRGKPFDIVNTISYLNSVPQPASFWRRSLWAQLGELREDLQFAMDGEYWIRSWVNGASLHHLAGERATYRLHENSKTVSGAIKHWLERVKIADEYLDHPKVKPHKRMIRANLAYMLGKLYLEQGNWQEARHWANRALASLPVHRRGLLILMLWSDAYLKTPFLKNL
jgi:glycosyltransferase involved in cell wall biosynthesis